MQTVSNLLLNGNTPVTVGGTGTTAKFFPPVPGPSINVASSKVGYIYPQGNNASNNQLLHVIAMGNVTPDPTIACPTFKLELVLSTNYTAASPTYTSICDTTARNLGGGTGEQLATQPWMLECWLQGDNTSGLVQGKWVYELDNTFEAGTAGDFSILTNAVTGVNMSAPAGTTGTSGANAPFALAVRATFGTTGAGNTASMYQFALEQ
jgi:hypothetical protein